MTGIVTTAVGMLRQLWLIVYVRVGNILMDWCPNSDEPLPPEHKKGELEAFYHKDAVLLTYREARAWWWWRNKCHDFTANVIGIADKDFESYPTSEFWNPEGGWLYSKRVLMDDVPWYKPAEFPWVSYKGKDWEFYLGWRPSGSFGGAWRRAKHAN